jgi:hypothetical protein
MLKQQQHIQQIIHTTIAITIALGDVAATFGAADI